MRLRIARSFEATPALSGSRACVPALQQTSGSGPEANARVHSLATRMSERNPGRLPWP